MARHKRIPDSHFDRCQFFGELRGPSSGDSSSKLSVRAILKRYPSCSLKASTIHQYANVWFGSHENTLKAFQEGKISYTHARILTSHLRYKDDQLEYLGVAMNSRISTREFKEKVMSGSSNSQLIADRYEDDGFSGKQTRTEKSIQDFLSDKFGCDIQFGRGRTNRLEWRIKYYGLDVAFDLSHKLMLVNDNEPEEFGVEIILRGFDRIAGRKVQYGDIVVRFTHHNQFTALLDRLAQHYKFG